ncbi:MAG: lysophospholipid acyltransferase family protein [Deltaproteobacteria bacterium]|nr:lysophospholipid acyltransferase family protein [Deltaproteobacteria bacterium]
MKVRQRAVRALVYYGTRAVMRLFGVFPLRIDAWLGARFGRAAYHILRSEREKGIKNILRAFPERDDGWARRQLKRSFEGFGISIMELIKLDAIVERMDSSITVENFEVFEAAERKGKGIVWITGHIGNWELMPVYFAQKGYPTYVVAKELYDPRMDSLTNGLRERYGVHPVLRGSPGAGKKILRALRSNAILGMLIDQDTDVQGVFVRFFGDTAFTPRGAADLAMKAGASVVAGFITRTGPGHHVIRLYGPIVPERTTTYEEDVVSLTQSMTDYIERHIRQHPSDWVWMHARWARRPTEGRSG